MDSDSDITDESMKDVLMDAGSCDLLRDNVNKWLAEKLVHLGCENVVDITFSKLKAMLIA